MNIVLNKAYTLKPDNGFAMLLPKEMVQDFNDDSIELSFLSKIHPIHGAILSNFDGRPYDSALYILNDLVAKYPNNAFYRLGVSKIYSIDHNRTQVYNNLSKAIELAPSLFENNEVQEMIYRYPEVTQSIHRKLKLLEPKRDTEFDPIELSKNGQILLFLKDTTSAIKYLRSAIKLLPSLSYPWYKLSNIEKCDNPEIKQLYLDRSNINTLGFKILRKKGDKKNGQVASNDTLTLFSSNYKAQFLSWYGALPVFL